MCIHTGAYVPHAVLRTGVHVPLAVLDRSACAACRAAQVQVCMYRIRHTGIPYYRMPYWIGVHVPHIVLHSGVLCVT